MRGIRTKILTIGLAILVASPVLAQRQRGPRTPPSPAQLLAIPEVQTELKLTDDEKAAITKITDSYKDKLTAAGQDRTARADVRKAENAEIEKAIPTILKPDQVKRLNQLVVQREGLDAFTKDDVATALKLTDDQKKTIKQASEDLQKDTQDLFQNAAQGDRAQLFTKVQTMRKDALDKVVNSLTDDQKKEWKNLTGEKFDFPAPMRGNRPGGARGNRGNRNATPPSKN